MHIKQSSRLSYHFVGNDDSEFLFQLDQNPEVMRYINNGQKTSKQDILNLFIPRLYTYRNKKKGWGLWKVKIIETQENIGWVLVRPMNFFSNKPNFHDIELGWRFIQTSWKKGYATEAAQHIKQAISTQPEYAFFSATALKNNVDSIAVMKKLGMAYVKTYTHSDDMLGNVEAVLYRIKSY